MAEIAITIKLIIVLSSPAEDHIETARIRPDQYPLYASLNLGRGIVRPYLLAIELFRAFCIQPCFAAFVARGLLLTPV
jgi:hypothetical protein